MDISFLVETMRNAATSRWDSQLPRVTHVPPETSLEDLRGSGNVWATPEFARAFADGTVSLSGATVLVTQPPRQYILFL